MIFINDMAKDNSGFPVLNSDVKHWEGACVGPTNLKNCEPNFHAFSQEEDNLMDLVPPSVMSQLKDKANWSNRLLAANEIERILKQPSTAITNDKLKFVVELIMISIGDVQFKVSQKGLQVMVQLVSIVGKRILSFLPVLTPKVLVKMGSTKGDLKKRGMTLFHALMEVVGPAKVVAEVCSCGITHKTSRVREESINVIILALLHSRNNGLHFPSVAKDLVMCMADTKPKVRQAAFEVMTLLTSKLDESEFEEVVTLIADVHSRYSPQQPCNVNLMDAYYARLERRTLPALNKHGLVQYSVAPVNVDGSVSGSCYVGADVDWIVSPLVMTTQGQGKVSGALRGSRVAHPLSPPSFRPNHSAGKRPWETEEHFEVASNSTPAPPTFSMEPPAARPGMLSPHYTPRTPSITIASATMKLPGNSYMDLHLSKQAKTNMTAPVVPGHMPVAVNPSGPHLLESLKKPRSGTNFFVHVASMNIRDPECSLPHHQDLPPSVQGEGSLISPDETPSSMSMTWPRATLCLSGTPSRVPSVLSARTGTGLSSVVPLPLKPPTQINADTISLVESQNSVKTSFSRPHSKPRVRNPLSSLKHSTQPAPLAPTAGSRLSAISPNQENTAAQLEQDFLRGTSTPHPPWTDQSFDDEYFAIPEDNTILNSSLSASLSSLKDMDADADKFKHIRKEAASRKAQILSTSGAAAKSGSESLQPSNQQASHHSHQHPRLNEVQTSPYSKVMTPLNNELSLQQNKKCPPLVHLDTKPPILHKKWNAQDYGKEDKTYSHAFLKKLATTPAKLKPAGLKLSSQTVPQPVAYSEEGNTVHSISLEGRGLDQSGEKPKDPPHHKKKHRKDQSVPNKGRTAISTSLFQEGNGERRPTIERGGTNTISMEVSGIGSRNSAEQPQRMPPLPAPTKSNETTSPKRTGMDYDTSSKKKSHSAVYPNNSHEAPLVVQEADESSNGIPAISSAPIDTTHKRNKKRKPSQGSSTPQKILGGEKAALGSKHTHGWNDNDSHTSGMGGALMEMDLSLLEGHVHAHPDHAVKAALQSLAKEDWNNKCEGIGMVVVLARDFPHILLPQLHPVLVALQKEVKNLRSSVSKKATDCLSYLFSTMKRSMEIDLDHVVQVLLHKSSESNTFLRESVEKALYEMVANVTLSKAVLSLITGGAANRNSQVRKLTAKYVCMAIELHEPSKYLHLSKDVLEKSLPAILQFTKDHTPECRYYGRRCLNMLWPEPEFSHVASKVFKNDLYTEAKEIVETLKIKGIGDPPAELKSHPSSTNNSRHPTGGSTRVANTSLREGLQEARLGGSSPNTSSSSPNADTPKKNRKQPSQPGHGRDSGLAVPSPTVALPDGLLERLQSSSWNERYEAISQLEDYVITARPQTLSAHLQRVFDAFTSKLTDRNSKVTLHALQAFANMVPIVHSALIPIIANILSTLVNNLASRNATLHSTAMTVLNQLSDHIDAAILIPSVANSSQYGNARVQPIMTKRLASLTKLAYRQKPQLVCRHVLPVVWHHVCAKAPVKGEARLALHELCSVLEESMQQGFLESAAHLSMEDNMKLKELLDLDGSGR